MEVSQQPVSQHRPGQRANVLESHVHPAVGERPGLARQHQELRRPHAGAVGQPAVGKLGGMFAAGPGRPHQRQRVTADRIGDGHSSHQLLVGQQALGADHRFEPAVDDGGGGPHHVQLLLLAEIVEHDLEGESVQLRLG